MAKIFDIELKRRIKEQRIWARHLQKNDPFWGHFSVQINHLFGEIWYFNQFLFVVKRSQIWPILHFKFDFIWLLVSRMPG